MYWLTLAAWAAPLSGRVDCDALAFPPPASAEEAWALVAEASQCNRATASYPPASVAEGVAWLDDEVLPVDRAARIAAEIALYAYGGAVAMSSAVEMETGLSLQERALDLLGAENAVSTELRPLDDVWRFEAGPAAALSGEAELIRQMLAVRSLSRRDRRVCEDFAEWLDRVGRPNQGLPHEVQIRLITAAVRAEPPENRSCALGFASAWHEAAARSSAVRARVIALTRL